MQMLTTTSLSTQHLQQIRQVRMLTNTHGLCILMLCIIRGYDHDMSSLCSGPRSSERRLHGAVVLCLGLLSVVLLVGLIILGVTCESVSHQSVSGWTCDFRSIILLWKMNVSLWIWFYSHGKKRYIQADSAAKWHVWTSVDDQELNHVFSIQVQVAQYLDICWGNIRGYYHKECATLFGFQVHYSLSVDIS